MFSSCPCTTSLELALKSVNLTMLGRSLGQLWPAPPLHAAVLHFSPSTFTVCSPLWAQQMQWNSLFLHSLWHLGHAAHSCRTWEAGRRCATWSLVSFIGGDNHDRERHTARADWSPLVRMTHLEPNIHQTPLTLKRTVSASLPDISSSDTRDNLSAICGEQDPLHWLCVWWRLWIWTNPESGSQKVLNPPARSSRVTQSEWMTALGVCSLDNHAIRSHYLASAGAKRPWSVWYRR